MNIFEMAKNNFKRKTWSIEMLQKLVETNKLTQEEYESIVNEIDE